MRKSTIVALAHFLIGRQHLLDKNVDEGLAHIIKMGQQAQAIPHAIINEGLFLLAKAYISKGNFVSAKNGLQYFEKRTSRESLLLSKNDWSERIQVVHESQIVNRNMGKIWLEYHEIF